MEDICYHCNVGMMIEKDRFPMENTVVKIMECPVCNACEANEDG